MEANITLCIARKRLHGSHVVLFLYWLILVIWQNIGESAGRGSMDMVIKLGLIAMLTIYFIGNSFSYNTHNLLKVVFVGCIMLISSIPDIIMASTVISYIFPVLFGFLCYCAGDRFRISVKEYIKYLDLIIFVVLYMVGYSLLFCTQSFVSALTRTNAYGNELSSFLYSSHEYGMYLLFAICGCMIGLQKGNLTRRKKGFYITSIFLFAVNLILTFSRTTYLALIGLMIVYVLTDNGKMKRWLICIAIITAIVLLSSPALRDYVQRIVLKDGDDAGRMDLMELALSQFKGINFMQKLIGIGYGRWSMTIREMTSHGSLHNAYLQVLMTNGILGVGILLALIIGNFVEAVKFIRIDKFFGAFFTALSVAMPLFMLTNTAVIFYSPIDCSMLTTFAMIVPKYVRNAIKSEA